MPIFRTGGAQDLDAVAGIQEASPEAARWDVADYPAHIFLVAECGGRVAGFLVARSIDESESEVLNLAVAPDSRRQGTGKGLMNAFLGSVKGAVFLEVRESNQAARNLYKSLGFQEVGVRKQYYEQAPETAIVMKLHS